jgi:uncharacterized Fe-S cluster protein YjdI
MTVLLAAAGWIAPAATMIAAIMTAANLGARMTGWGFVVFTLGAAAWTAVGMATGQHNLVLSNAFLFLVDLIGVWRWLGRRARYDAGARIASARSAVAGTPALFPAGSLQGRPVLAPDGATIATVVEAMAACRGGAIRYLVVQEGGVAGVGERLHAIDWAEARLCDAGFETRLSAAALARRTPLDPQHWPIGRAGEA